MSNRRHKRNEMVEKLQKAKTDIAAGATVGEACKKLQISEQTYYRWRGQLRERSCRNSPLPEDFEELKVENDRLKRLVVNLALQLQALKDEAEGIMEGATYRRGPESLQGAKC